MQGNVLKRYLLIFLIVLMFAGLANALCWKCNVNYDGSVSYTCDYNVCNWHECSEEGIAIGSCGDGGSIDVEPPNLTVSSPIEGNVYNVNEVLIEASSDETVKAFKRKVDRESYRTTCAGCDSASYLKTRLRDGEHTVIVHAVDYAGNVAEETINFKVDTTEPVIEYIFPGNNFFVRGGSEEEFRIRYDEENVDDIILYYKVNSGSELSEEFDGCGDGEDKECGVLIDLSSYNEGDEIEFYVKLKDKAGNVVISDKKNVTINAELAENPFVILNPDDDGKYGNKRFNLNVQSMLNADLIEYSIDGKRFRKQCADCEQYEKILSVRDGEHELAVKATYEETEIEKQINFYVDSLDPKIKATLPKTGSWVKGDTLFSVKYSELNLESVILHYGVEGEGEVELDGCEAGNNKECSVMVDLSDYNGQEILYFFEINDKVNSVSSNNYNLLVDVDKPVIELNSPSDEETYTSERVLFDIELDDVVEMLEYIDDYSGARTLRPKRLCKSCNGYKKELRFKEGNHNVKIMATDQAGNTNEISINFRIDTRYPKFNRINTYGRDITNGEFTLTYNEENLVEVMGYYKGVGEESFKTQSFGDCPSGKKGTCEVKLNLDSYNDEEVEYYFALTDILGQSVTSDGLDTAIVDTEVPEMAINSIENLEAFNARNVLIDVDLSEEVKSLGYTDNSASRPRFIKLCSSCSGYERERSFSRGVHEVTFKATDYAGNVVEETRTFIVSY